MTKSEDKLSESMKILKTSSCKTLSGKSTLTYQIGSTPDSIIHLRITKNTGGGFFSDEWISLDDILRVLKDRPRESPVMSHFLTPILKGKSANTSGFILAMLSHLNLLRPLPKKKRVHELLDPGLFLNQVNQLMASEVKTGGTVKKAPTKKATVKKRATTKRKTPSA
jgi:hypothetical protein